jgi:hypothetical protein
MSVKENKINEGLTANELAVGGCGSALNDSNI